MFKRFLIAFQFLTVVPVSVQGEVSGRDMTRSAAHFPLVGLVIGFLLVVTDVAFGFMLHPDIVAALVLLVLVLLTGGFHLDGLADMADALACKGDKQRKLDAMKDSTTGPIGVVAIVFALGLKYLALRSLSHYSPFTYYHALLVMPMAGRWAMLPAMRHGLPARPDGLGRIFIGNTKGAELLSAAVWSVLAVFVPAMLLASYAPRGYAWFGLGMLGTFYIMAVLFAGFCKKQFGGLTGDTLGALGEVAEVVFILAVIIWSGHYL